MKQITLTKATQQRYHYLAPAGQAASRRTRQPGNLAHNIINSQLNTQLRTHFYKYVSA